MGADQNAAHTRRALIPSLQEMSKSLKGNERNMEMLTINGLDMVQI